MRRENSWVALVGPEFEENLSLRYLAASLDAAGYASDILAFNREEDLPEIVMRIMSAPRPPVVVGLCLAFQWRAKDFLALAMALRQSGYRGHITAGGHFATFASREILADFPELDSICRQESEETLVSLTRAVEQGEPSDWASLEGKIVRGEMPNPAGIVGTPEDIGELVAFLASDRARYVNGANVRIDGGASDSTS